MKHIPKFPQSKLEFSQLMALKDVADNYIHLGEDYILTRITSVAPEFDAPLARRFDGVAVCIGVKGEGKMLLNLDEVIIKPNSLLFIPPDAMFRLIEWSGEEQEAFLLFLSNKFIHDINIDLNAVNTSLFAPSSPILQLDEEKVQRVMRYFYLLHDNASDENAYSRYIARSLMSAAGYQIMAYAEEAQERELSVRTHSRKLTYVQKFLRLVRDNHRSERAISFYAGKMFISPKYLSLIIKDATGKSAGEWIDSYVIQEAKNMLRYSGKNVQQIAYELNFTNQSSFGKYFKNITGMSPTAFQNAN